MSEIRNLVLSIIAGVIITVFAIFKIKKSSDYIDKAIYSIIMLIYYGFCFPLMLDWFNIPSVLNWTINVSSSRWFEFSVNYITTIIGAIIGGIITICITIRQLKFQTDSSNDSKRIENAPIFKYLIQNNKIQTDYEYSLLNNNGNIYKLFMNLENVGLNHARNVSFLVQDITSSKEKIFKFDKAQSILKKDDNHWVEFVFNYKYDSKVQKNNNKHIRITIYYEDLLCHKYSQEINIYVEVTDKSSSEYGGYQLYIVSTEIENEVYLKDVK